MEKRYKLKFVGVGPVHFFANGRQELNTGDIVEVDETAYRSLVEHADFEDLKTQKQTKEAE